jgi:hypothetical protein
MIINDHGPPRLAEGAPIRMTNTNLGVTRGFRSRNEVSTHGQLADDQNRSNPFDLAALRVTPDLDDFTVDKDLNTIPVRKPKRNEFFRVHSGDDFVLDSYFLEHESEMDRTTYLVAPDLRSALVEHLRKVRLFTCMDKRSNVFLWPSRLPTADGSASAQSWYRSALLAAERAKTAWIRIAGNKAIGAYETYVAKGDLGEPQWPDHTFAQLVEIAFRDKRIADLDHPVIRDLHGEI